MNAVHGTRVREVRKEKGLSQRDLAIRSGLALSVVAYSEKRDTQPRACTLLRIARALGVPMEDLVSA